MKNPHENTGISGQGKLWHAGVNRASDVLVLGAKDGVRCMVAIKRKCGRWAMPGGFHDAGEDARSAALRELQEECGLTMDSEAQDSMILAYEGYVQDPRNTDDAWIETSVFLVEGVGELHPTAGDDAQDVCFLPLTPENVAALYPGHAILVKRILDERGWTLCPSCFDGMLETVCSDDQSSHVTRFLVNIMTVGMQATHAHSDYLVRLLAVFTLVEHALTVTRTALEERVSKADIELVQRRIGYYLASSGFMTSTENFEKLLTQLPALLQEFNAPKEHDSAPFRVKGPSGMN